MVVNRSLMQYREPVSAAAVPRMLVNLIDPVVDAGDVAQAVQASVDTLESVDIAFFDSDVIYDFRAQRPFVEYKDGKLVDLTQPRMDLSLVTDMHGENFLYLSGSEPDFRWNTLSADLLAVIDKFQVREVYSFAGMPAGVPHTRPADMLIRTTRRDDVQQVPGHAEHFAQLQDFFEYKAGQAGISVTNIRVRVPFYMARGPHSFISGALAVMKMMASLGGPMLPLGDLEQLEDQQMQDLSQMVEEGSDFAQLLAQLEEDYDHLPSDAGVVRPVEELPSIPSAEEISVAAEQFLASLSGNMLSNSEAENGLGADSRIEGVDEVSGGPDCGKRKDGEAQDYQARGGEASPRAGERTSSARLSGISSGIRDVIARQLRRGKHHASGDE